VFVCKIEGGIGFFPLSFFFGNCVHVQNTIV
jgi:hypothetical protein